jgi:hypothetical protein
MYTIISKIYDRGNILITTTVVNNFFNTLLYYITNVVVKSLTKDYPFPI